ncbi:MAG: hypothetical protein IKA23_09090 [Akkermansia sp.]|nr:hypothetical protein [Akkermansia sp.]MBR2314472.1 hypothetical protein [Akkermansia sp.]
MAAQAIMAAYQSYTVKKRSADERDGVLFYILPPLLLGAVFAFCAMANSNDKEKAEPTTAAEASAEN